MGFFNFSSKSNTANACEELNSLKTRMEIMTFSQAFYGNNLSDEAQGLYIEYCKLLNSILCAAVIKTAYKNAKGISDKDNFTKQLFRCVVDDVSVFQRKYTLTGKIKKEDDFGSTTFKRFNTNMDVLEFVMIHEGSYFKDFKVLLDTEEAFEVDSSSGRKYYHEFLQDMFCVKVTEERWGIRLEDEKIHLCEWERTKEFLEMFVLEYKALVNKYQQKK